MRCRRRCYYIKLGHDYFRRQLATDRCMKEAPHARAGRAATTVVPCRFSTYRILHNLRRLMLYSIMKRGLRYHSTTFCFILIRLMRHDIAFLRPHFSLNIRLLKDDVDDYRGTLLPAFHASR